MNRFTRLYIELDESNRTTEKLAALERYFSEAPPADAAWALAFLTGRRLKRAINATKLREWAAEEAGIPSWLLEESYDAVGDLGETIALLLPPNPVGTSRPLHELVDQYLVPLPGMNDEQRRNVLKTIWREFDPTQRFVWHKLMLGSFRVGVSQTLVVRALATATGVDKSEVAHRLMGDWQPTPEEFLRITSKESSPDSLASRPYPFYLAYPLEAQPSTLGTPQDWQIEWKWDGIRAQLIRRRGAPSIWSRGEELITDRFPEIAAIGDHLPDGTVIDGEIVAWREGRVMPFQALQQRIGRKTLSRKVLLDAPAAFMAYDLLEHEGTDLRTQSLTQRRALLEALSHRIPSPPFHISPLVHTEIAGEPTWENFLALRTSSRERGVEGMMIKRRESTYQVGRVKGDWWKWKVDPFTIDAVMTYAQRGSGKRASLYTDYTFAVWQEGSLVPVAKAYSGLTDAEIRKVDTWVRRNTLEKFGPVRVVKPELVFELAFEGIQRSARHKSGVAVRFPRIARWRTDKKPEDADKIERLLALIPPVA